VALPLKKFMDCGWQVEGVDFDPEAVKSCAASGLKRTIGDRPLFNAKL